MAFFYMSSVGALRPKIAIKVYLHISYSSNGRSIDARSSLNICFVTDTEALGLKKSAPSSKNSEKTFYYFLHMSERLKSYFEISSV